MQFIFPQQCCSCLAPYDSVHQVHVITNDKYAPLCDLSCSCTAIVGDPQAPSWVVCVSKLINRDGIYQIRVNLNQMFYDEVESDVSEPGAAVGPALKRHVAAMRQE